MFSGFSCKIIDIRGAGFGRMQISIRSEGVEYVGPGSIIPGLCMADIRAAHEET